MLIKPIVTEKTVSETNKNRFAFRVALDMRKPEIKSEVEKQFKVKVKKVTTAVMPGKAYRTGKKWKYSYKPDWKKAVVTLETGQKIDLFDVGKEEENNV